MENFKSTKSIKCGDAYKVFAKVHKSSKQNFLLESKDVSHVYGRLSLIGIDPLLEIRGKNDEFQIEVLNSRGIAYLEHLKDRELEKICDHYERGDDFLRGRIEKCEENLEESKRTKRKNVTDIVRLFLQNFRAEERGFLGLYGAFSYDFIRLFEDIPKLLPDNEVADFRLFLYDTFIFFDHLKSSAEIIAYRENEFASRKAIIDVEQLLETAEKESLDGYKIENAAFDLSEKEYMKMVEDARELARKGELFEVVYSNTLRADFSGTPLELYKKYAEVNPSPYLFYFDFADEQLIGASPEMMVRCEHGQVHLRPISGTAKRGEDPVEDHENMLTLLQCEKERAELDMLIDLGRNDLARICEPGIKISDYRFVEKYSKVMHTVAHVSGHLRADFSALDALIACANAGTLTGAPKFAAMCEIEKNEATRRGYYGGAIGYLTLSGDMDTGILIRTAHIKDGKLSFRVGATLLYDSDPKKEYEETLNKAQAFLTTF